MNKLIINVHITETAPSIQVAAFQIYDDLSDAWSQEDDEISEQYLNLRSSLKVNNSLQRYVSINLYLYFFVRIGGIPCRR